MFSLLLLIVIYLSYISLGLPDSLLGSAWPSMHVSLRVPQHYAGFISMITSAGTIVSSLFSAKIIKRFGAGIVTAVSVLMTAASLAGFSFLPWFSPLCFFALVLGLGAGSIDVALNSYVALNYKARHMNWLHCFWGIGASFSPAIMSYFLANKGSWEIGYRVVGAIQFCIALILFGTLFLWEKNNIDQGGEKKSSPKIRRLLKIAGVKEDLAALFCYCALESVTFLWGSSFLVNVKNAPPETAARWIALFYIGMTSGRFISGFVTIKLNHRQMVGLGQALLGLGVLLLVLPLPKTLQLPAFFIIGIGCAPISPSILHAAPEKFGAEHSEALIGLQMTSVYAAYVSVPPLFGRAASFAGFGLYPVFIGALLIFNIVLLEAEKRKIAGAKA